MAERVGFEPTIPFQVCRISSAVLSTTQPPLLKPATGLFWGGPLSEARNLLIRPRSRKRAYFG